jgi:hypothetical protein
MVKWWLKIVKEVKGRDTDIYIKLSYQNCAGGTGTPRNVFSHICEAKKYTDTFITEISFRKLR